MTLGNKLQRLRKQKGMSQEHLANELGVSRQAVSKWELDQTLPETENILQLSRMFSVSADYLLKEEMEEDIKTHSYETNHKENKITDTLKKYGYYGGYILSAVSLYCFLGYVLTFYYMKKALTPPRGFEVVGSTAAYNSIYAMAIFYIVLSLIGLVGGVILAGYIKKKTERYRNNIDGK